MSVYVDCLDGIPSVVQKHGRTKKGYRESQSGIWIPDDRSFSVEIAENSYYLQHIESAINYGYMRKPDSTLTCLFMCDITPSCKIKELFDVHSAVRINLAQSFSAAAIWYVEYNPSDPDLIILDLIHT